MEQRRGAAGPAEPAAHTKEARQAAEVGEHGLAGMACACAGVFLCRKNETPHPTAQTPPPLKIETTRWLRPEINRTPGRVRAGP